MSNTERCELCEHFYKLDQGPHLCLLDRPELGHLIFVKRDDACEHFMHYVKSHANAARGRL